MRRVRQAYYDIFSRVYDRFVALHSRDSQGLARKFLVHQAPIEDGDTVLDLCTGTGTLLIHLQEKVGASGYVVGVDFSGGMLEKARQKTKDISHIILVQADASALPFRNNTFDVVTCSHAFYELKGEVQDRALQEIVRVLRPGGAFLMMEHDVPAKRLVRVLFYLRMISMGSGRAITFLRHEQELLERYFHNVTKVLAPAGRSKVLICRKDVRTAIDEKHSLATQQAAG